MFMNNESRKSKQTSYIINEYKVVYVYIWSIKTVCVTTKKTKVIIITML